MNRRLPLLAEVDPQVLSMQQLFHALRGRGVDVRMRLPPPSTCLRFQLTGRAGR